MLKDELQKSGLSVVASVGTGDEAEAMARVFQPVVAVLDIDMPGRPVFDVARTIRNQPAETRIIFLSAFVHDHYVAQALAVQASGYLTKGESAEVVVRGIQKVANGGTSFSQEVLDRIVIDESGAYLATGQARIGLLTDREREVLAYVAKGLQQKQIATRTGISVKTVQHHITHLMDKLAIHDRVELARFAIREGLIEP